MENLTLRQQLSKKAYPLLMKLSRFVGGHGKVRQNKEGKPPQSPVYDLNIALNDGTELPLHSLRGRKILVVNTASDCGYTEQYSELQQLSDRFDGKLAIIGFPANDFKEQEKGSDAAIAQFCTRNFGVRFPLARKSSVVKGQGQHPVFAWLSQPDKNGWNDQPPVWNFSKYLLDEQGRLTHYFGPAISPLGNEVKNAIEKS